MLFNFSGFKTRKLIITIDMMIKAYELGVCLDKKAKQSKKGIMNHEKNLLFFIPRINE